MIFISELIIAGVAVALLIIVVVFILVVRWRRRAKQRQASMANHTDKREPKIDYPYNYDKLSPQPDPPNIIGDETHPRSPNPPPVPTRPASYTPSVGDSVNTLNTFNNLDSFRDYGSAGDELESMGTVHQPIVIPEFLTNVDADKPMTASNAGSPAPMRSLPPPPPYEEPAAPAHWSENHNTNDRYKEGERLIWVILTSFCIRLSFSLSDEYSA